MAAALSPEVIPEWVEPGLAALMNSHVVASSPARQRLARYLA